MTAFVNATARSSPASRTSSTVSLTMACGAAASRKPSWYAPVRSAARTGGSSLCTGRRPERVDAVVERPHALHGPVRDPLRERSLPVVEPFDGRAQRAVCVRVLLEDTPDDPVRGAARRVDDTHRAKPAAELVVRHPAPLLGLHLERERCRPSSRRARPDRDRASVERRTGADVRRERTNPAKRVLGIASRSTSRSAASIFSAYVVPSVGCGLKRGAAEHVFEQLHRDRRRLLDRSGPASSSGPIGNARCAAIGPASNSSTSLMIVTPVSRSPAMIARSTGAAPLQRGSSDGWTFSQSCRSRSADGTITP